MLLMSESICILNRQHLWNVLTDVNCIKQKPCSTCDLWRGKWVGLSFNAASAVYMWDVTNRCFWTTPYFFRLSKLVRNVCFSCVPDIATFWIPLHGFMAPQSTFSGLLCPGKELCSHSFIKWLNAWAINQLHAHHLVSLSLECRRSTLRIVCHPAVLLRCPSKQVLCSPF